MSDGKVGVSRRGENGRSMMARETVERRLGRQYVDPEVASHISEVPPEPRPFSADAPRAGLESGLIFLFFALAFGIAGYFTLTDGRIVDFIGLNHLNEAYMTVWNDPPRLAAIGLDAAALISVIYIPFSIIKPFATSLVAMPVMTAIAAGLLMASLNTLMRNCEINLGFRLVLLVLFGLNPLFVYYAGNGDSVMVGVFLLGVALSSLISWGITDQTRHLAAAGLAMGVAVMVDYGYFVVAAGLAIGFMILSAAKSDDGLKTRSTLLLFLTPVAYALLFWCLINWVLIGNPFEWISAQDGVIQVNTDGALQAIGASFGGSLGDLFEVTLGIAPLALLAAVLAIVGAIMKKDATGWALLIVGLAIAAVPLLRALGADQANLLDLHYGIPLAVFAVATTAWFGRDGWGVVGAVIMGVGLIAAIPLGWNAMQDYRYQNQAEAFTRWVDTRESQEGTASVGGYQVGIDPELSMAQFINNEIPRDKRSVLVDQNFSYGVILTSGRPQIFYDRVDEGEDEWQATIDNPFGTVNYMLIAVSRAGDQIAKKWPTAVQGGEAGLEPVFRTDRYVLLEVAGTRPPDDEGEGSQARRTEPNPVTPVTPVDPEGPSLTTPSQAPTVDPTPISPGGGGTTPETGGSAGTDSFGGGDASEPGDSSSSAPGLEGE